MAQPRVTHAPAHEPVASGTNVTSAPGDAASRFVAHGVDLVLASALAFLVAGVLSVVTGPVARFESSATGLTGRVDVQTGTFLLHGLVAAAISAAWFVRGWSRGATPGMRWCGLRVAAASGDGLGRGAALRRWVVLVAPLSAVTLLTTVLPAPGVVLWVVALAWYVTLARSTAADAAKRGLHDRIAGSTVLRTTAAHRPAPQHTAP